MALYLTTTDNPFNPKTQFEEWSAFDHAKGYNSMEYLARICPYTPDELQSYQEKDYEQSINEIVEFNLTGKYISVEI